MPSMLVRSGVISPGRCDAAVVVGSSVLVVKEIGCELVLQTLGKDLAWQQQQRRSGSI